METIITTKNGIRKGIIIITIVIILSIQGFLLLLNELVYIPFYIIISVFNYLLIIILIVRVIYILKEDRKLYKIKTCIERNLKIIGATTKFIGKIEILPEIYIDDEIIYIKIDNINIRRILDKNIDIFSSALPNNYIVNETNFNKDETKLIIKYEDISKPTRIILDNIGTYRNCFDTYSINTLPLDKKRSINLKEQPHILISGSTGSGKSYYAMFLAAYSIYKGFDVRILDYKQSYTMFENSNSKVAYSVEEIYNELLNIRDELHNRQLYMREKLKIDNNLVASDCGKKPIIVFVEEYTGLMNSGADKKIIKEIENILLEISSIGRSASIHLILITQVASATNINTSIRSNLVPLVMGNGTSTIYETALGCKVPNITVKLDKGEGLGKFDINIFRFSTPTVKFSLREVIDECE